MAGGDAGWTESAGYEGDFISVRREYEWGVGNYQMRLAPHDEDDGGIWYGVWITDKDTGQTTWGGSLRFPLVDGNASIDPYAYSTLEIYGIGTPIRPIDIPQWHVSMERPLADQEKAWSATFGYGGIGGTPAENVDVQYDRATETIDFRIGGVTERVGKGGKYALDRVESYLDCFSDCAQAYQIISFLELADLSAEVTFINPVDGNRFEYGFSIRGSIQIWVASDRTWTVDVLQLGSWTKISSTSGDLAADVPLDTSREGENYLYLIAEGEQGCLYVNSVEAACFQLPADHEARDVWINSKYGSVGLRDARVEVPNAKE